MDIEQAREAIETRFRDAWTIDAPDGHRTPYALDGQNFETPTKESSVRLTILDGGSINASVGAPGSNTVRYAGVVSIQVFVPGGTTGAGASAEMRRLVNLLRPIFSNWQHGRMLFRTMEISERQEARPFLMQTVTFNFQRDEHHG